MTALFAFILHGWHLCGLRPIPTLILTSISDLHKPKPRRITWRGILHAGTYAIGMEAIGSERQH